MRALGLYARHMLVAGRSLSGGGKSVPKRQFCKKTACSSYVQPWGGGHLSYKAKCPRTNCWQAPQAGVFGNQLWPWGEGGWGYFAYRDQ